MKKIPITHIIMGETILHRTYLLFLLIISKSCMAKAFSVSGKKPAKTYDDITVIEEMHHT